MLKGFYYKHYFRAVPQQKNYILLALQEHILSLEKGKELFTGEVTLFSRAFALAVPHPAALRLNDELALFQLVKARLNAFSRCRPGTRCDEAVETAVQQIVSKAVAAGDIFDIFDAAGIKKPGISIFSEEFLAGIKTHPHPHVALEFLKNLLEEEIYTRTRKNLVQGRSFLQVLSRTLQRYSRNQVNTMEVIEQLIRLANDIRRADSREKKLRLTGDELAFYDALTSLNGVSRVFPEKTLKTIAQELVMQVRNNTTIDWAVRESARARLNTAVKRTLRSYRYPVKERSEIVDTILKQAECLAHDYYRDIQ
jgi:type I restriction enzyme R subunit